MRTLDPDSEVFGPCPDAGGDSQHTPTDAGPTPRDAAMPPEDASTDVPDATMPATDCSSDTVSCAQAAIVTASEDATCTIHGDVVSINAKVCEKCGKPGRLLQFWVTATFCDSCGEGSSNGDGGNFWFEANACMPLQLDLDLSTWVTNNPCIDVHPRFDNSGDDLVTDASYSVRSCRCDREKQTCMSCADGACDQPAQ